MSDGFEAPKRLPPTAPGRKIYAFLFALVAFIVLISTGFDKARTLPENISETCRQFRLCGPKEMAPLPDLQTEYIDGIGAIAAAQPTLEHYQTAYPDYSITFHPDDSKEHGSCDNALIKTNCRYSYGGSFSAEPKWTGNLEWVGALLGFLLMAGLLLWTWQRRSLRSL